MVHKICQLSLTEIKKSEIEIAHLIKNVDIIIKFKDCSSQDLLDKPDKPNKPYKPYQPDKP